MTGTKVADSITLEQRRCAFSFEEKRTTMSEGSAPKTSKEPEELEELEEPEELKPAPAVPPTQTPDVVAPAKKAPELAAAAKSDHDSNAGKREAQGSATGFVRPVDPFPRSQSRQRQYYSSASSQQTFAPYSQIQSVSNPYVQPYAAPVSSMQSSTYPIAAMQQFATADGSSESEESLDAQPGICPRVKKRTANSWRVSVAVLTCLSVALLTGAGLLPSWLGLRGCSGVDFS